MTRGAAAPPKAELLYLDGYRPAQGAGVRLDRVRALLEPALAENLPVAAGKPQQLRAHLERLAEGAQALAWACPDLQALAKVARELPRRNGLTRGSLRLRYWGGLTQPLLLAQTLPPRPLPKVLRLLTSAVRHYGPESLAPRVKSNQMLPNLLALAEVQAWAEDGLRLTPDGLVAECVWSNLVALKRGVARTPPLAQGLLQGVTRAALLERLRRQGHAVRQEPLTRYDLWTADALWACSSLQGARRVASVDGRVLAGA